MRVEDEFGGRWVVHAGDPANPLILRLKRFGVDWVVLPRLTLITGKLGGGQVENTPLLRRLRLGDCLRTLFEAS